MVVALDMLMSLKGHTAIVTGAGRGLGAAIALRLAEAGAAVVIADMDEGNAKAIAGQIIDAGGMAFAVATDVADIDEARRVTHLAVERFGGLDILVNNAGIFPANPFFEVTENSWDALNRINTKAVFFWSQAAARHMVQVSHSGRIINLASSVATLPAMYLSEYSISKATVAGITRSLALELGSHGIRVNAIAPGMFKTPGLMALHADIAVTQALDRPGEFDDIARAALFFASGLSDFITGTMLAVDGGYLLCASTRSSKV